MNGYALGILISLLVYAVIGNWAGRRVKNLDDFLVAGRQSPTLLIVGTLVASSVSTSSFLGESGFAYSGYVQALIFGIPLYRTGIRRGKHVFWSLYPPCKIDDRCRVFRQAVFKPPDPHICCPYRHHRFRRST